MKMSLAGLAGVLSGFTGGGFLTAGRGDVTTTGSAASSANTRVSVAELPCTTVYGK